jgi:hypothetical protein
MKSSNFTNIPNFLKDLYRAYVGPSNIAGKNIISNELGAQQNFAYRQTLPILLAFVKRAWASGNNQMVFHGASYSGQYPNTTVRYIGQ